MRAHFDERFELRWKNAFREEFDKLQVEINDEKSRTVDLGRGDSFGFLGFDFRYTRSFLRGVWRPYYTPKHKKRTALVRALKEVFRRHRSQPIERVINLEASKNLAIWRHF